MNANSRLYSSRTSNEFQKFLDSKGVTAPRVTPEMVYATIVSKSFTALPSGKSMVCEIVLEDGWVCHGIATVVSKENYKTDIAEGISYEKARSEAFKHTASILQFKLFEEAKAEFENKDA